MRKSQFIFFSLFLLTIACQSWGATFRIVDGDVNGLINAIITSNSNLQPDTIYLPLRGKYTFTNPIPSAIIGEAYSALPDIKLDGSLLNQIVIWGNGSILERDTTAPAFRILLNYTGAIELNDLWIRNGKFTDGRDGAGIYNNINLVMNNCTLSNNTGAFLGGALYNSVSAKATITNCTMYKNKATTGGAIYFYSGNAEIANCTITGNYSSGTNAKAIFNALNTYQSSTVIYIKNSIIAGNKGNGGVQADIGGILVSVGNNLIGENSDANTAPYFPAGNPNSIKDYVGTSLVPIDPLLDTLKYIGGLTPAIPIKSTSSPAFNNGGLKAYAPVRDQAGNNRVGNPEIGSMEYNSNPFLSPGINIQQNNQNIPQGTGSYDFSNVNVGDVSDTAAFVIQNTGFSFSLRLLANPLIYISGNNASDFTILSSTTDTSINGNSQTSFGVFFKPSTAGSKDAVISIASNDSSKTIYTFHLKGNGIIPVIHSPKINVKQGIQDIATGTGYYDFGNVLTGKSDTIVFVIQDTSATKKLTLSGNPLISISSGNSSDFSINTNSTTSIIDENSETKFSLIFSPVSQGTKDITISIANNDPSHPIYTFHVTGKALSPVTPTTSVLQETDKIPGIRIYPNPVADFLKIEKIYFDYDQILLMNMYGETLKEINVKALSTMSINMIDIKKDMYILMVKKEGTLVYTSKIIKE